MSAIVLMMVGIALILLACVGTLGIYLLIIGNMEKAEHNLEFSTFSKQVFGYFLLVVLLGVASISGFVGGLSLIDLGVKKMDSFEEGKK